jgi:predicted DNA binding CopG/RHH family protein
MKKGKQLHKTQPSLSAEETLRFLEDFAKIVHHRDLPTKLISLRVPENILNAFKVKAKSDGRKYQSVIVNLMRQWLLENDKPLA